MDTYETVLLAAGMIVLLAAWLPARVASKPLSVSIILVAIGAGVFSLPVGFKPDHIEQTEWFERISELGVIMSLMGAGLKLDRPIAWLSWSTTWRLLGVAMPLTITLITLFGLLAGLPLAGALLVASALAPTDPVLAAEVQVGEPATGEASDNAAWSEDEVRFSLTSEAGLNDGLAFPFVYAAIALEQSRHQVSLGGLGRWLAADLFGRVALGIAIGWAVGRAFGYLLFADRRHAGLAESATGFVALAATLLAYGLTELAHGYGFVAVFVAALTIRTSERAHSFHRVLHDFIHEIERLLIVGLVVLLGGALVAGLLDGLDWRAVLLAIACIFVARPAACWASLIGARPISTERRAIAFFGIRGIGSIYYLSYALSSQPFRAQDRIWAIVALTVLVSIVVHGVAATPMMRRVDTFLARRQARQPHVAAVQSEQQTFRQREI